MCEQPNPVTDDQESPCAEYADSLTSEIVLRSLARTSSGWRTVSLTAALTTKDTSFRGPLGLGFRRLSIIDLTGGHQPMSDQEESVWVMFNGEIYNFPELKRELEASATSFVRTPIRKSSCMAISSGATM